MSGLFYNCSSLTTIDLTNFQTNNVITMKKMFAECSSLRNINLKNFETHNLKDMSYMFKNCKRLNYIDFNITINSKNNIYKKGLFYGCKSLRKKKYDFCIIGYWFGTNYGSLATYYALHQAVKNMGYSILMIDSPIAPLRKSNYDKCHPIKIGRDLYNISEQKPLNRLYQFNEICKGFLLGSDQLWKPLLSRPFKQFFFLHFAYNKVCFNYFQ
jgi:surface protein